MEAPFEDFGSMTFGEKEMAERLPRPVYLSWKKTVANEYALDRTTADAIAHAMKRWALEKGATHYTHWFQPMTGTTAEKHDSFIDPGSDGQPITHFSGKSLIKGEPDASSFPSGGLRATFEARGYTYWDVTSPVFVRENVLCIPTIFVSYTGESLDKKDPLLRSIKALSTASTKIVNLFGDKDVKFCTPVIGLEQEYFLIDKKYYEKRRDLKLTGRTLFGSAAPKGQELEDHYFGSIPPRVDAFMTEVDKELWKLGIYAKTEHNEVAPGQFELASVYANANVATDQNQLVMDVLRKVAEKHDFACLLHEKPFAGINGSGKHNNYSIMTDNGQNLFTPGEKPAENVRFLVFISAFIKAVDTYPELLRMGAACPGNDFRLGASEAPPAIISIYLGNYIEGILNGLVSDKAPVSSDENPKVEFAPISGLAYLPHDNTDRNRTSPVAFTGNKFEFRMLGSSMSASLVNVILDSIMADTLNEIAGELEGLKYLQDIRSKAMDICRDIIKNHKRILFSGDGYSEGWLKEAEHRGLPNIRSSVQSYAAFDDPKVIKMFTELGVYNPVELAARKTIYIEQYIKTIGIEVKVLQKCVREDILPAMSAELKFYSETAVAAGDKTPKFVIARINQLSEMIDALYGACGELEKTDGKVAEMPEGMERGTAVYEKVCPAMISVRDIIDTYEKISSTEYYKMPSYEEMLFNI